MLVSESDKAYFPGVEDAVRCPGEEVMMERRMGLTGEESNHKVAGIFGDVGRMQQCRDQLVSSIDQVEQRLEPLGPGQASPAWLLEPESRGIWHTLVRAHVWLGLAGVIVAGLLFVLMTALDVAFVVQNPWAAAISLLVFGAIGGGLLGGLVTLRPDHTPYITRVRAALDEKRHILVIHAADRQQMNAIRQCVERHADETVATL